LKAARELAQLKAGVQLLDGETLLEAWAADGERSGGWVLGLVLVTRWRVIFVDLKGGMTAFPILKIEYVETNLPSLLTLAAWDGRITLRFDSPAARSAVLNLLRQDASWAAAEFDLSQAPKAGIDPHDVHDNAADLFDNDLSATRALTEADHCPIEALEIP
jgi:hypothetical protein